MPKPVPQKKQTARKTTGKHLAFSNALKNPPPTSKTRSQTRRRPNSNSRSPLKSILKTTVTSLPGFSAPVPPPMKSTSSRGRPTVVLPPPPARVANLAQGPLVTFRRPSVHVLDKPISVCKQFATWLESQICVRDAALLPAIERDGRPFLALAKASVAFDNALRGRVPPTANGVAAASAIGEHARTLRDFAALLSDRIAEGSLSRELETAVLRDGEALLRLALCCLEFDGTIRGTAGNS